MEAQIVQKPKNNEVCIDQNLEVWPHISYSD